MKSELKIQEIIMNCFSECCNSEEVAEMESMILDITQQEKENCSYELRN